MKSILVLAAAFALSTTAASAACLGHDKTASTNAVDKEIMTASATKAEQSTPSEDLLLQQKLQQEKSETEE